MGQTSAETHMVDKFGCETRRLLLIAVIDTVDLFYVIDIVLCSGQAAVDAEAACILENLKTATRNQKVECAGCGNRNGEGRLRHGYQGRPWGVGCA